MKPNAETRGTCPVCGYRVRVSVPPGGDGSARVCARHHLYSEEEKLPQCDGSRRVCVEDAKVWRR